MNDFEKSQAAKIASFYSNAEDIEISKAEERLDNELLKARVVASIGEIRDFGGRSYIKTAQGWKFNPKGRETTQDDKKGSKSGSNQQDKGKNNQNGGPQIQEKGSKTLLDYARETSEQALKSVISDGADPKLREAAHKELDRRAKEEHIQEKKDAGKGDKVDEEEQKAIEQEANKDLQKDDGSIKTPKKISEKGIALIKDFEKLRLNAYKDSAGIWTIGYGSTRYKDGTKVKKGDKLKDKDEATELFDETLKEYEAAVKKKAKVPLTKNQFDALVSFTYNAGKYSGKTLFEKLNEKDFEGAAEQFGLWNKITDPKTKKKVEAAGLTKRRKKEKELFLKEDE